MATKYRIVEFKELTAWHLLPLALDMDNVEECVFKFCGLISAKRLPPITKKYVEHN